MSGDVRGKDTIAVFYREIQVYIKTHFEILKGLFGIKWKRVPAYSSIRKILHKVDAESLESIFRRYS